MEDWTPEKEAAAQRLLDKFKKEPFYEERQELGTMLMRHIDSFTPAERKRYDELKEILKNEN